MNASWENLISRIGEKEVNKELDDRVSLIYRKLQELSSVCTRDLSLLNRIKASSDEWLPARDQYERTILHLAAMNGNTRLVRFLVYAGGLINERDGISQTPLTLAMHKGHMITAKVLIENGASVDEEYYIETQSPQTIASISGQSTLADILECKREEQQRVIDHIMQYYNHPVSVMEENEGGTSMEQTCENFTRFLNINVGDQKNTANIQGCINRCPDVYSCHTPGGGDFHNRGYINECIARVSGTGGFWYVTKNIMKRPTVNPVSFKNKFKDNNYNNNEEALLDYDDGLSIAMLKKFQESDYFPSESELENCLQETGCHNKILTEKFSKWLLVMNEDVQFKYQSQVVNELMPITRWYKESVRYGNGLAVEGVWMMCPQLYASLNKINYRDESFTMTVNCLAKWPLAYRKMYQQNRSVNINGNKGRQLAGDEWVEGYLVAPVKRYASAQTSFQMLEMMSCSTNILEETKKMYKSKEAFDIHSTKKHCKPSSFYDKLKIAQFAISEDWFENSKRADAKFYQWEESLSDSTTVPNKYLNILEKGDIKAKEEFQSFLLRKFPNEFQ